MTIKNMVQRLFIENAFEPKTFVFGQSIELNNPRKLVRTKYFLSFANHTAGNMEQWPKLSRT